MKKKYVAPAASAVQFYAEPLMQQASGRLKSVDVVDGEDLGGDAAYSRGKWSFGKTSPWEDSAEE